LHVFPDRHACERRGDGRLQVSPQLRSQSSLSFLTESSVSVTVHCLMRTAVRSRQELRGDRRFVIFDAPNDANLHVYLKELVKHNVGHVVRVCDSTYETTVSRVFFISIAFRRQSQGPWDISNFLGSAQAECACHSPAVFSTC
jgi:hypothetical protein